VTAETHCWRNSPVNNRGSKGGLAIDAVIRAHHRADAAFAHRRFELGQVGIVEIALGRHGVNVCRDARGRCARRNAWRTPAPSRTRVVALQAGDERDRQPLGEEGSSP